MKADAPDRPILGAVYAGSPAEAPDQNIHSRTGGAWQTYRGQTVIVRNPPCKAGVSPNPARQPLF
jgi:hypothetical protein